ncbi:MAG: putative amidase protein, partial [Pseudonocardiales bacterium]|nr:putative amidase protein [Pseudonocardiales bacterium]
MSDELTWLPAWRIREMIGKREVSCVEVTEHFLNRIDEFNPTLHAFEEIDHAGAREQAVRADQAVSNGDELGDLHGIPTSVKSHIRVNGLHFRQGATDEISTFDDISVERLRRAGAIIVGTNTMMGAGANLTPNRDQPGVFSPFNWEAEARNPWDVERVPGWSSSGGAASAAARLLPVTIGSDGGGSTRLPAAYSGVVGLHTSRGLIPHLDYTRPKLMFTASYGPLGRNVRDVALFTRAMSGGDGRDYVSIQDDTPDCRAGLDRGVEGMKVAWTEDFGYASIYATEDSARIIDVARAAA